MEETLTVHRLGVPETLRKTLFSTNPIESALSVVEDKCRRVKRWFGSDMKLRWVASGLLFAEGRFRKVKGFREISILLNAITRAGRAASQPTLAMPRKAG